VKFSLRIASTLCTFLLSCPAAAAERLSPPAEKPILVVSGRIGVTNDGAVARFDREMLEQLGTVSFTTETPWHTGRVRFEGVPLAKILDRVEASGSRLVAVALNDYSAELPITDASKHPVIVATKMNGSYMSVQDKGPLFIVYDYDSSAELKTNTFFSRSVWQVKSLEVR